MTTTTRDLLTDPVQALPLFSGTPIPFKASEKTFVEREAPPAQPQLFDRLTFDELAEGKRQREALAREKKTRAKSKTF